MDNYTPKKPGAFVKVSPDAAVRAAADALIDAIAVAVASGYVVRAPFKPADLSNIAVSETSAVVHN